MIRVLLERFSRNLILRRRLPPEFGGCQIFASPESALRFWYQDLTKVDPTLFRAVRELVSPGDVVWDVGSNVGLFAFAAAGLAGPRGQVLAIEADIWLAQLLRRSAAQRSFGSAQVRVLPGAVSAEVGVSEFEIAARGRASNHLEGFGNSQAGGTRERQLVMTMSLDSLLTHFPPPNVLKIDIEGAEALAIRGASRLLSEFRPRLLVEVSEANAVEVGQTLRSLGYVLFDADADIAQRVPLQSPVFNTLALP